MIAQLEDVVIGIYETEALLRAIRNLLPNEGDGDELVDTVSLLCAAEKKLSGLAEFLEEVNGMVRSINWKTEGKS